MPAGIRMSGGYTFKKFPVIDGQIQRIDIDPGYVAVPLVTVSGDKLTPAVKTGHFVRKGDCITAYDQRYPHRNLYAPITGRVEQITKVNRDAVSTDTVIIRQDTSVRLPIENHIGKAGAEHAGLNVCHKYISLLTGQLDGTGEQQPKHILISAIYTEPVAVTVPVLLEGNESFLTAGIRCLLETYPDADVSIISSGSDQPVIEQICGDFLQKDRFRLLHAPRKYPAENPYIQIENVSGYHVSALRSPADYGYLCIDLRALLSLGRAVIMRHAPTDLFIPVYRDEPELTALVTVPVGVTVAQLLDELGCSPDGYRIIEGGLLTGKEITDTTHIVTRCTTSLTLIAHKPQRSFLWFLRPGRSLDSFTRCFLSSAPGGEKKVTDGLQGGKRACINCGYCHAVCPADLYPNILYHEVTHDLLEEAMDKNLDRCIDCGLCSYVCPSKLSLAYTLHKAKDTAYHQCAQLTSNRT